MTKMTKHLPVLCWEAIEQLNIRPDGVYVDCTFGRGGHSGEILKRLNGSGVLLGLDRDTEATNSLEAKQLLVDERFTLHHRRFSELAVVIDQLGYIGKVNGILMDLGVSSPQLDNSERGFSFLKEGPLDMRMDFSRGLTASQYLEQVEEQELARVIFEFGEERFARRIANAIVEYRRKQPLLTTLQLAKLIEDCIPFRDKHKHPATRTFQAIRIAINQELEEISSGLKQSIEVLESQGRLVVISFHSLEDRIVKRFIRDESGRKINPGKLPIKEQDIEQGQLKKIGKSIRAQAQELKLNPRARSAVMRVAEKI